MSFPPIDMFRISQMTNPRHTLSLALLVLLSAALIQVSQNLLLYCAQA